MNKIVKNGIMASSKHSPLTGNERSSSETAYLEMDKNGNIICANYVMLTMLSKDTEEVLGQPLTNILPMVSNNPKVFYYVWLGIQNGIIKTSDFILISKNKKESLIRFNITLEIDPQKEISRVIMISNNTTPVEHKQYAYKSAQQALDDKIREKKILE